LGRGSSDIGINKECHEELPEYTMHIIRDEEWRLCHTGGVVVGWYMRDMRFHELLGVLQHVRVVSYKQIPEDLLPLIMDVVEFVV
jgi:hypothetical protein